MVVVVVVHATELVAVVMDVLVGIRIAAVVVAGHLVFLALLVFMWLSESSFVQIPGSLTTLPWTHVHWLSPLHEEHQV